MEEKHKVFFYTDNIDILTGVMYCSSMAII